MRDFPKHLNTKDDYMYVLNHFPKEKVLPLFKNLLDTMKDWFFVRELGQQESVADTPTMKIIATENNETKEITYAVYELQENPQCKLYRLGFSVEEVKTIINKMEEIK